MGALCRHCMLGLALIAAGMILGSRQTRAEFISAAVLTECDGVNQPEQLVKNRAVTDIAGAGETWRPQIDTDDPHHSPDLFSLVGKEPSSIRNIVHRGMLDGSSQPDSSNGPSSSLTASLPDPQAPPLELTNLLSPQTGVIHPIFMAFFLFRPPRASHSAHAHAVR